MKSILLIIIAMLSFNIFADSTNTAIGNNLFYLNIPSKLGFERQLPNKFFLAGELSFTIVFQIERKWVNYDHINFLDFFIYREFNLKRICLAPTIGFTASSEYFDQNLLNGFYATLQIYHRFIIINQFEIIPIIRIFNIKPNRVGVLLQGSINPEFRIGIAF